MLNKMMFTVLPMALVAFALMNDARGNETFEGTVVETSDNSVTIHDLNTGEYQMFVVESVTEITLNGEPAGLADLYPFFPVTVVAESDGNIWFATEIVATANPGAFCSSGMDAKIVNWVEEQYLERLSHYVLLTNQQQL
jgi:hypothetical protein